MVKWRSKEEEEIYANRCVYITINVHSCTQSLSIYKTVPMTENVRHPGASAEMLVSLLDAYIEESGIFIILLSLMILNILARGKILIHHTPSELNGLCASLVFL